MENGGTDKELTPEILNEILPDNINKILHNQYLYTNEALKGRELSDLVAKHYEQKHQLKTANFN